MWNILFVFAEVVSQPFFGGFIAILFAYGIVIAAFDVVTFRSGHRG